MSDSVDIDTISLRDDRHLSQARYQPRPGSTGPLPHLIVLSQKVAEH